MGLMEDINRQHELYMKGMLTYSEMLNNIISLAEAEKSYIIEYKTLSSRKWKPLSDTIYTLLEAKEEIERLNGTDSGYAFRYKAIA